MLTLKLPKYTSDNPVPLGPLEPTTDLVIYVDGSCQPNPGNMYVGVAVFMKDDMLWHDTAFAGAGTNNQAEYHAFIHAARALYLLQKQFPEYKVPSTIVSDSRLAVDAYNQIHLPSNPSFGVLFDRYRQLIGRVDPKPSIIWVPRAQNKRADRLSKLLQPSTATRHAITLAPEPEE